MGFQPPDGCAEDVQEMMATMTVHLQLILTWPPFDITSLLANSCNNATLAVGSNGRLSLSFCRDPKASTFGLGRGPRELVSLIYFLKFQFWSQA